MGKRQSIDSRFLGRCPICDRKFSSRRALLLDKYEGMQTVYIECRKCGSSVVLGVARNIPGIVTTIGMLTDMTREDIERISNMKPITADDVLEMHKCLENN